MNNTKTYLFSCYSRESIQQSIFSILCYNTYCYTQYYIVIQQIVILNTHVYQEYLFVYTRINTIEKLKDSSQFEAVDTFLLRIH